MIAAPLPSPFNKNFDPLCCGNDLRLAIKFMKLTQREIEIFVSRGPDKRARRATNCFEQ